MQITNETKLNLVIGHPLEQSKSPNLHQLIYQNLNINAVLLAKASEKLEALMSSIRTLNVELTAVTIPYKEKVIPYLDDIAPEVKASKACNTIIQRNGKLIGFNTDIDGINYAFRKTVLHQKNILIIGAG